MWRVEEDIFGLNKLNLNLSKANVRVFFKKNVIYLVPCVNLLARDGNSLSCKWPHVIDVGKCTKSCCSSD